ncbi:MAG: dolichol-phosphate mannosyltransferase [Planctomycetota bacterium]|nr:MAG: dolichol-phosphate mannosyltransferase [Planctomycetota bacterium]
MSTSRPERLGVVIPLLNEQATLAELLGRVLAQLQDHDQLFAVVDGGSRDDTRAIVQRAAQADPRVQLVWEPDNRHVVGAYLAGFRAALHAESHWILEMDAGLSHQPEEIPRFLRAMECGAELAAGSRFLPGGRFDAPRSRWLLSRGGTWLANRMLGTRMRDMTSGFQCFSARALRHVLEHGLRSRAGFYQTEVRHLLRDWNWVEVPIRYVSDLARPHRNSVGESLRLLRVLRREARAER